MSFAAYCSKTKSKSLQSKAGMKGGVGQGMFEKRLQEAASIHLRLGQFKEYCEILVELQEWESAVAIAPAVSMEYWQSLASR